MDSNEVEITTEIKYATLARAEKPEDMLFLKQRRGSFPGINQSLQPELSSFIAEGRKYPIAIDGGHRSETFDLAFTHRNYDNNDRLYKIVDSGNVILYRDNFGNKMYGVISSLTNSFVARSPLAVDFSFPILRTDYVEGIEYD